MSNTPKTDSQDVEAIAAQLECIAPALESPQFKAAGWSSDLRHAAGVIRQLERERDLARELAGYYRGGGDDNKRKRKTAMDAAIGAGYCGHLRGPETHSC